MPARAGSANLGTGEGDLASAPRGTAAEGRIHAGGRVGTWGAATAAVAGCAATGRRAIRRRVGRRLAGTARGQGGRAATGCRAIRRRMGGRLTGAARGGGRSGVGERRATPAAAQEPARTAGGVRSSTGVGPSQRGRS